MKLFWKAAVVVALVLFLASTAGLAYLLFQSFDTGRLIGTGGKVAVIPLRGEITLEGCTPSLFDSSACVDVSDVKERLRNAERDSSVKAIVLDIDSGGGAVVPSKELAYAVRDTKKPVVACIRQVGASGAYYVASAADWVVADEDSLTGSIGVIMTIQHLYGLYEKLGINVTVIKSGETKDIGSPYREMTESEKAELKEIVDEIHSRFIADVAENRGLPESYVRELADGSMYLGSKAKELGLIDELGGIDDAIDRAAGLANITGEPVVETAKPKERTLLDYLMES